MRIFNLSHPSWDICRERPGLFINRSFSWESRWKKGNSGGPFKKHSDLITDNACQERLCRSELAHMAQFLWKRLCNRRQHTRTWRFQRSRRILRGLLKRTYPLGRISLDWVSVSPFHLWVHHFYCSSLQTQLSQDCIANPSNNCGNISGYLPEWLQRKLEKITFFLSRTPFIITTLQSLASFLFTAIFHT